MQAELTEMVGASVYKRFLAYIGQREQLREQRVPLPHPAVRKRAAGVDVNADPDPTPEGLVSQTVDLALDAEPVVTTHLPE